MNQNLTEAQRIAFLNSNEVLIAESIHYREHDICHAAIITRIIDKKAGTVDLVELNLNSRKSMVEFGIPDQNDKWHWKEH